MKFIAANSGDWQQCPGYAKKILLTGDDLDDRGALVQVIEMAPRTSVADHSHRRCTEVFHGVQGRGRFVIDGQSFELGPGDTLTCQPGEVHSTHNDADAPFSYVVFKTNAEPGDIRWLDGGPEGS